MIANFTEFQYHDQKELQIALRKFVYELNLPLFVTMNFNTDIEYNRAIKKLSQFQKNLDRKMFGRRFYKKPPEERIFFIAMPEHLHSNLHLHILLRVPKHKELFLIMNAWFYLQQLVPSATVKISKLATDTDVRMTSFYSCKDAIHAENYNKFVISSQFASFKKQK